MKKISNPELNRPSLDQYRNQEKLPLVVVADNIRSLHNVGSLFRTADAFGVDGIYLCGITACPPNKEIHKTALGAEISVRWEFFREAAEGIRKLKEEGYRIIAAEQAEGAVSPDRFQVEPGEKYAVVLGNEVKGVSDEVLALCEAAIEIPQVGTKHSLNVSVSAGVILWELFKKWSMR